MATETLKPNADTTGETDGDERGHGALAEHVSALIELLSRVRRAPGESARAIELNEEIDARARTIRSRFKPAENTVLAGARLKKVIGVGNFGTVWEAVEERSGERVAVKVFRLERLTLSQMLARFRRSIRAMRLLSEDKRLAKRSDARGAIVGFREADPSTLAFSMDLLGGGSMEEVERFGWDLERKLEVMLSVCGAVKYSHANGVIHRDIKPANIVLDDRKRPVLTDFDISDIRWATSLSTSVEGSLGTPIFAAPEQLEQPDQADERSDIYSLGRLLYYLLLERSPGYQVERDPALTNLAGYPAALVEIVRRATQYDKRRRLASVEALMNALERCQTGAAARRAQWARAWRFARRNWAPLMILLVLLGGVSGFALYQRQVAADQAEARAYADQQRVNADRQAAEAKKQRQRYQQVASKLAELDDRRRAIQARKTAFADRIAVVRGKLEELRRAHDQAPGKSTLRIQLTEQITHNESELLALEEQQAELDAESAKLDQQLAAAQAAYRDRSAQADRERQHAACKESPMCTRLGRCVADENDACIATSAESCRASKQCKLSGECTLGTGECIVSSNDDCRASRQCKDQGACTASEGKCVVTSAVHCLSATVCKREGQCGYASNACAATRDEDCRASVVCTQTGACSALNGVCQAASESACRSSSECRKAGKCSVLGEVCAATSDRDCWRSRGCRESGLCTAQNGACQLLNDSDCQLAKGCRDKGQCGFEKGTCRAKLAVHCTRSLYCTDYGACEYAAEDGTCWAKWNKDCEASTGCTINGKCEAVSRICQATQEQHCRDSDRCASKGECYPVGGACQVASDIGCRASSQCKRDGRCMAKNNRCVASSDADCAASRQCKFKGLCGYLGGTCQATTDDHCRRTPGCKTHGTCAVEDGKCQALLDEHCRDTLVCREQGRCFADSGKCTRSRF